MSERGRSEEVGSLILRGIRWKLLSQVVLQAARVAVGLALAHLLTPGDFGVAAMVLILSGLVLAFSDLALGAGLIQRQHLSEADRSTVFWTGLGVGICLTLVGLALSGPVAAFFGEPEVRGLFAAFSLSFVVTALGTTQKALLTREMDFKSLELRLMVGTVCGGALGIVLAANGAGAWAIIIQQLTIAVLSTILLWVASPWRPRFMFSIQTLRELGGFSASVFGTRVLYYLHENAGSLIIGRVLGAAALGTFTVAYTVILAPFSRIAIPVAEVLFPAFSRIQDEPERIGFYWVRGLRLLGALCIPALLGLIVVAPEFVSVVLGAQWSDAVPVIQVLAWVGLLQALQSWNGGVLMGLGHASTLFRFMLLSFVVYVLAFGLGVQWGLVGVAICYAIASTLLEVVYLWLTTRVVSLSPWILIRALSGVTQAALIMVAGLVIARVAFAEHGLGDAVQLVLLVLLGIGLYVPACAWRAPEVLQEVRSMRRRRAHRGGLGAEPSAP